MSQDIPPVARWRLVLGDAAAGCMGSSCLGESDLARDAALSWLYRRDANLAARDIYTAWSERGAGSEASTLSVPNWINEIHQLFPRRTIERLERDAVERFQIHEVVTNPEVLRRIEPNAILLQAVLRTKHLMNPEVLALAREMIARVVRDLMERLASEVRQSFFGPRDRRSSSPLRVARNFDARRTIRENLKYYDPERRRLVIKTPHFFSRNRRHSARWQIILLVDESGSMAGSVIHAAVTAACLWGLPSLRQHLCIFDTEVVDLTNDITDPVEVLMKVQLGGGTDIGKAVAYAADLIDAPRRAIVILITDFFEGGDATTLVRRVKSLCDQGTIVLGLAALDPEANPAYDRDMAQSLVAVGAEVGAMTPGELATWIASKVQR